MTHTACKNKAVKDFVGTEVFVKAVKYGKLTGVNDTANGVNNASGQ